MQRGENTGGCPCYEGFPYLCIGALLPPRGLKCYYSGIGVAAGRCVEYETNCLIVFAGAYNAVRCGPAR